jgi:hypothetical protein
MSKTKGFEVDFKLPDGQTISRHLHKLDEMKDMVERYKIPAITIHNKADKWSGSGNDVSDLVKWPLVPDRLTDQEDDCPICNPPKSR